MSTSSELEMSECSNSSLSCTSLESPYSSPVQQVPQLTSTLTSLSCSDKNLYKSTEKQNVPFLRITEQPQSHFRFRYDTEKSGSTHGSILGKSYVENKTKKKTHPTVELVNYSRKAEIRCSIKYNNDKNIHKNIYKILEDEQITKSFIVPKSKSYNVGFPGVGVHTIKKTALTNLLYNRLSSIKNKSVNMTELREHCDNLAKSIDQNVVRLKFSAHDVENGKEICEPVFSEPILNKKNTATNALKICRMSMYSGRPSGGDDIFLLVDKIDKNEVKVRFFEEDENGTEVWSAWGNFLPSDVHYQCAIVCRTPQYINPQTSVDVKVWIELVRSSYKSEAKEFKYIADPVYKQYKRRKIATPRSMRSESNFSDAPVIVDQPVIVLPNDPIELKVEKEVPQKSLQSSSETSESEWSIISSALEILENGSSEKPELQNTPSPMWGQCQLTNLTQSNNSIAVPQALPTMTEFSFPAPKAILAQSCITATQPLPPSELGIATTQQLPSSQLGISTQTQPLSIEMESTSDVVDEDISELLVNGLTEYAELFDMCLDDLFQSDIESNKLVADSGRVKVEPSTSSPQSRNAAGAAQAQGPAEISGANENANDVTSHDATDDLLATGANEVTSQSAREGFLASGANENPNNIKRHDATTVLRVIGATVGSNDERTEDVISTVEELKETIKFLIAERATEKTADSIESRNSLSLVSYVSLAYVTDADARATGASKDSNVISDSESEGAVAGGSKHVNEKSSMSAWAEACGTVGLGPDPDRPALFTPEDAVAIKKLVVSLCSTIRDKRRARSDEVRAQLDALFDIRLNNGDTFLHVTLFKNQRSFEALVKLVASVKMTHLLNLGNNRGETILHLAVIHGSPELVSMLVSKGCSPAARNVEDESPVHYAVRYAGAGTLRALLEAAERAGAALELDAANAERQSALHLCALHGRAACAALLGARGASGGARDAAGRTPLHLCAYDARASVARALLPHAAPHVHARDGGGRTPLAVAVAAAAARGPGAPALELARALLAAGARAAPAWAAAAGRADLQDLLRPYMTREELAKETDVDEDDDDEKPELEDEAKSEPEDDEYESADDEYMENPTPEFLSFKLAQMELSDDVAKSSAK